MRQALVALVIGLASFVLSWRSGADETPVRSNQAVATPPHRFLPADAVAAWTMDGSDAHQPAVKLTASWKALEDTQYLARIFDLLQMFIETTGEQNGVVVRQLVDHIRVHGVSAALAIRGPGNVLPVPDSPFAVTVLHNAEKFLPLVDGIVRRFFTAQSVQVEDRQLGKRTLSTIFFPVPLPSGTPELSWWSEGGHFVLCAGIAAAERVAETLDGKAGDISGHASWKQLRKADQFTVTELGWLDISWLLQKYGNIPLPAASSGREVRPSDFFRLIGIDGLKDVTLQTGISNTETWNRLSLNGKISDNSLLSLWLNQRPLALSELPPLPKDAKDLTAGAFDLSKALGAGIPLLEQFFRDFDPEAAEEMQQDLASASNFLGADLKTAFAGFGDVWCGLYDTAPLPVPGVVAPAAAISLRDRAAADKLLQRLLQLAQPAFEANGGSIQKTTRDGNDFYSLQLPADTIPIGMPLVPTLLLTQKWFVASLTPAAAQTFTQREAGKMAAWKPAPLVEEAIGELPTSWSAITISDPAPFYAGTLQVAPAALMALQSQGLPIFDGPVELPFAIEDLPSPEMVTEHLFPNVTVTTLTPDGHTSTNRQSVPSTPVGNVNATFTLPVAIALMLPAVQQAREAARRTQSKNNLKMLALAAHFHNDVHNHFPTGTVANPKLKPEQRLSWAWSLLPYLEQESLQKATDKNQSWDANANSILSQTVVPGFQNPSQTGLRRTASSGDYVGIAGVGANAAMLPLTDPKVGMFGYDRKLSFRDITDGSSNTLMFGDSTTPNLSMFAGGPETIRGFSQSPYLNGPDGIGSPHSGGVQFAFADGTVRFISVDVDEKILEALATIRGGEVVGDF